MLVCPSDPRAGEAHHSGGGTSYPCGKLYPGNYLAVSGSEGSFCSVMTDTDGMFYSISNTRMRDARDGTSSTMLAGERDIPASLVFGWGLCGGAECEQYLSTRFAPVRGANMSFGSWHDGGLHFLFGDGSVQFLNKNINLATYRALSTRDGGEVVGSF